MLNKKRNIQSVVLLEPTFGHDKKHAFGGHNEFEPLGLEYITAVLHSKGYKVNILMQMSEARDELVQKIISYNPDVVCFSVLTYNFNESIQIARKLKHIDEKIIVVFGGYHPSTDTENVVKNNNVDFVVIGEGETTVMELFDAIENSRNYESISGIAFLKNSQYFKTTKRIRIKNIDTLPFPLRNENTLKDCKIYGLMYPPPSKQVNVAVIACSRGCPFNCEFCCSNALWGKGVTYRSPHNIIKEIRAVQEGFNTNAFFFTDLTFNSSKRWVKDFCYEILNSGLNFRWYCMCTILGLDAELIRLMSQAGCRKIGFGIETLDDELSNEIKSFKRPLIEKMNEIYDLCFENEIFTKAYLMIGFPNETYNKLLEYKNKINEMRVDEIKISFYTPFPGTRAFEKYKHKLAYNDFSYFDTLNHLVIKNNSITEDEYKIIRKEIIRNFYNSELYVARIKERLTRNPALIESYDEFFNFLKLKINLYEGIINSFAFS
ncbi:MAG: B12-binding domain-containing radical SAM protein [Nitrospinae bacterium]|nr:B12-binding domain-containing radical SAM protein [Nitrospinota bacterium]